MSLKEVKTIGYDFFVDHLLWAFDLYDDNRNARLKGKRSYSSKQDVYVNELHEKLMQTLCNQNRDVRILVNGLLDFSEVAASYVLSKSVVTSFSKEQLYQLYAKHILCSLLVAYMEIFSEFHDEAPVIRHLDTLLSSINEQGVAHAARKMLLSILAIPECNHYREELTEFIRDIRPDRTQRRATIEQKIRLAKTTCSGIENLDERQKCVQPLADFQDAYIACMAAIYFDIKTGLGCHFAWLHQITSTNRVNYSDISVNSLSSSIIKFIATPKYIDNALPKEAKMHINNLWKVAINNIPRITNPYVMKNINTMFYLLGYAACSMERIKDHKESERFLLLVENQEDMRYLKPYAMMLQLLYYVKNEQLQEALALLDSDEACLFDDVAGSLPYYAAVLFLGLTIKTNSTKLKNGNFSPLIQIIINTQELYDDIRLDSAGLLKMKFTSFISNTDAHAILRSIKEYNHLVSTNLSTPKNRAHLSIIDTWNCVEAQLEKISKKLIGISTNNRVNVITSLLTKADKEKVFITYLPNSTLYHCVRELESLLSYLPISSERHPHTLQLLEDIVYRKTLLMALDPAQYEQDSALIQV